MFETECVLITRHMIDDVGDTPTYSDTRIIELLLVSALRVKAEVTFPVTYSIDVDALAINPDPTLPGYRDDNFISLITLKAASLLAYSEAKTSAGQGIAIKDGSSSIDLKGVANSKLALAKDLEKQYQDAKYAYQAGSNGVGKAILTPYKVFYPTLTYNPLQPLY